MLKQIISRARPVISSSTRFLSQGQQSDISHLFSTDEGEANQRQQEDQAYNQAGRQYQQQQYNNQPYDNQTRSQPRRTNKGINRVELLGGVAGDPFVKTTSRGSEFASFNLYTNVDFKLANGDFTTNVEVHNVVAFGGVAKYVKNNIVRGTRVYLTGRLHYTGGQLLADGTRTPRMASVNLENIYPLARAQPRNNQEQEQRNYQEQAPEEEE